MHGLIMTAIFLINLARSTERLANSQRQLAAHGLSFERIDAIDGAMLSQAQKEINWLLLEPSQSMANHCR